MSINLISEVAEMCRNHVVLSENKCIARKIVKHNILVGTCVSSILFKSNLSFKFAFMYLRL